jgi:flagellar basal body-associated protein FliL
MPILLIVVVVAVAAAAGAAVYAGRRKRMAQAVPEQRVTQRPQAAVPYKPAKAATLAPATKPPPATAKVVPEVNYEAKATEAIKNTEEMLQQAEKAGLDVTKARQSFKIAKNFYGMGKYEKAVSYCKTAEDYLG